MKVTLNMCFKLILVKLEIEELVLCGGVEVLECFFINAGHYLY